jgi:hypothetical protein
VAAEIGGRFGLDAWSGKLVAVQSGCSNLPDPERLRMGGNRRFIGQVDGFLDDRLGKLMHKAFLDRNLFWARGRESYVAELSSDGIFKV